MNDYIYDDGGRHKYFQMKYKKDRVADCVIRALSIATKEDYQTVRCELWLQSLKSGDMPNGNSTWQEFLKKRGFKREPKIKGFSLAEYPVSQNETYVVVLAKHLVCLDKGVVRDIWDCRSKYPYATWRKPN